MSNESKKLQAESAESGKTKVPNTQHTRPPGVGGPTIPNTQRGSGQKVSKERGSATNNKKNPGKRPKKGGN